MRSDFSLKNKAWSQYIYILKKNQSTPRPSEHPPSQYFVLLDAVLAAVYVI